jgi:hypothetical protein
LTWQVEGKLGTWISRKKRSDFQDLAFLFRKYGKEIRQWSEHLSEDWRREFYEVYKIDHDKEDRKNMKRVLRLD